MTYAQADESKELLIFQKSSVAKLNKGDGKVRRPPSHVFTWSQPDRDSTACSYKLTRGGRRVINTLQLTQLDRQIFRTLALNKGVHAFTPIAMCYRDRVGNRLSGTQVHA